MKRIKQAIGKLFFCLRITKGWNSFYRLVIHTKRFSRYYKSKERSADIHHRNQKYLQGDSPESKASFANGPESKGLPASGPESRGLPTSAYNKQSVDPSIRLNHKQPTLYQLRLYDNTNPDVPRRSRETYLRTYAGDIQMFYDLMLEQSYQVPALNHAHNLVIVDAGANIGMAALYFLHHYHVSKIFCIEPDAENLKILKMNLQPEITCGKVAVIERALSSDSGTMAWNNSGWAYNAKLKSQDHNQILIHKQTLIQGEDEDHSYVSTITIEDFFREHQISHIDLLKIDVEGAEEEIFQGDLLWLNKVQRLIIEIHNEASIQLIQSRLVHAGFDFHSCSNSPFSNLYLAVKKHT